MDIAELVLAVREGWVSEEAAREHWRARFHADSLQVGWVIQQHSPQLVLEAPVSPQEATNVCSPARDMGETVEGQ